MTETPEEMRLSVEETNVKYSQVYTSENKLGRSGKVSSKKLLNSSNDLAWDYFGEKQIDRDKTGLLLHRTSER